MKFKNSYIVILFFVSCVTYSGLFDLARKVPYGDRLPCVKVEDRINFYK